MSCVIVMQRQAQLLEIVAALHPPRGLPSRLYSREQQRYQDADDRDPDQQFHQRKTV